MPTSTRRWQFVNWKVHICPSYDQIGFLMKTDTKTSTIDTFKKIEIISVRPTRPTRQCPVFPRHILDDTASNAITTIFMMNRMNEGTLCVVPAEDQGPIVRLCLWFTGKNELIWRSTFKYTPQLHPTPYILYKGKTLRSIKKPMMPMINMMPQLLTKSIKPTKEWKACPTVSLQRPKDDQYKIK